MKKGEKIIQIMFNTGSDNLVGLSNLGRLFLLKNKIKKGETRQWELVKIKETYE
jgi:hypothetical protein